MEKIQKVFYPIIRKWNEVLMLLPLALIVWMACPTMLRLIDPTAAVYDAGVLMKFVYAFIGTCFAHFTLWVMLKLSFPNIHRYIYGRFESDIFNQSIDLKSKENLKYHECKRLKYSLFVVCFYVTTYLVVLITL